MRPHVDKVLAGEYDLPPHLEWIAPPRLVLDIGANVGAFTAWACAKWPAAIVHAYEPVPENFEMLMHNTEGSTQVFGHRYAVSDADRQITLHLGATNCGEASMHDLAEQISESIVVEGVNAAMLEGADFIKIDAEGEECAILAAMDLDGVQGIAYEWHGTDRRDRCRFEIERYQALDLVGQANFGGLRGVDVWARRGSTRPRSEAILSERPHHPHVFIALPVYGGVDPWFHQSLMDLIRAKPRPYQMTIRHHVGDSLVSRARNRLVADFLRTDCTHLLFIDSDLIFSPAHVARVLAHDAPIVAGLYPKKQRELGWVCNLLDPSPEPDAAGLQPVKYAGTGFLCIAREVFERIIREMPELRYDPDDGDGEPGSLWDFFKVGVWECPETGYRRYLSEDWWFCQIARDVGYEVLMDTQVICKHVGQFVYPFDSLESFASPAPDGADAQP